MNEPRAPGDEGDDLARLYRSLDQPAPDSELDDAIRGAAREALRDHVRSDAPFGARPVRRALGVAALVVLSASVVLLMPREEAPPELREPQPARAPLSTETPAGEPGPLEKREVGAGRSEQPPRRGESEAGGASSKATRPQSVAPVPPQAPAAVTDSVARQLRQAPAEESLEAQEGASFAYRLDPALWISHIERLLSEGRFEEAEREYQAFREAHPGHAYSRTR